MQWKSKTTGVWEGWISWTRSHKHTGTRDVTVLILYLQVSLKMHFFNYTCICFLLSWVSFCLCSSLLFGFFLALRKEIHQTLARPIYPVLHPVSLQQQLLSRWFTGKSAAHWITVFIWHISSALLMKTHWFLISLRFLGHEFSVCVIWVSLLLIFLYMHLVVCLFLNAFVIIHCTFININESNEALKKASFILWLI